MYILIFFFSSISLLLVFNNVNKAHMKIMASASSNLATEATQPPPLPF